jgi:predicted Zn-dependent protease
VFRLGILRGCNFEGDAVSDNSTCESLALAGVNYAMERGSFGVEVHIEGSLTRVVTWDVASLMSAVSLPDRKRMLASVRVYAADGRCGMASGKAKNAAGVCALIDTAGASLGAADPYAGPADCYAQSDAGLGLMDRRYPSIDEETREAAVNENIRAVAAVPGATALAFRYTELLRTRAMAASNGNARTEEGTFYTLFGKVQGEDGQHTVEQTVKSRVFADVGSLPMGADLAAQVGRYQNPAPLPEGEHSIFFSPRVAAKIMTAVVPAFERDRVDAGKSFLTEGRMVASEKLHMIDDGLLGGGFESRAFDVRGVPSLDLPLIREGTVGALYQGVELARELGGRSCGHEGPDGCWYGNLILRPGTRSRNMIAPDLGRYLCLDELCVSGKRWFDIQSGKLRLNGHFFSARHGEEPVYVGIHTITTSFVDLWSGISEVANDQRRFGAVDVSSWVVDGLRLG